jgi:hypothetical protein
MNRRTKLLIESIERMESQLEQKRQELREYQRACRHVYPDVWETRAVMDHSGMSGAIDHALRSTEPGARIVRFMRCTLCGLEIRK